MALGLIDTRFEEKWADGVLLVILLLGTGLVLALGLLADPEGDADRRPRAYVTVLLLTGLLLALGTLVRLAEALGADGSFDSPGTTTWVTLAFAALALAVWRYRRVAFALLFALVAGGVATLAFVDWVFDPESTDTFRWVLVALIAAYVVGHLSQRDRRPREGVLLVDAAGLAALALAFTLLADLITPVFGAAAGSDTGGPTGWEVVLVVCGCALVAYAAADREPGPGVLGVLVLLAFGTIAGTPGVDGPSLVGWPGLLLLGGLAVIAAGLRPARPLPPEPSAGRPGEPAVPVPLQPEPSAPAAPAAPPAASPPAAVPASQAAPSPQQAEPDPDATQPLAPEDVPVSSSEVPCSGLWANGEQQPDDEPTSEYMPPDEQPTRTRPHRPVDPTEEDNRR